MKTRTTLLALMAAVFPSICHATIEGSKRISIDFTDPVDASTKATWARPDLITASKDGLGWDGDRKSSLDGWIETKPIAVGESWRTPDSIFIRVSVRPRPSERVLSDGHKFQPDGGDVFVRYSPDLIHWSSWQVLQRAEPESIEEKALPGRFFSGMVRVPLRDRNVYQGLLREYSRRDVPWGSDEEAAVKWIVARDPDFFSRNIPFIGYAQLLFEGQISGGDRIQSFRADVSYGMGGKSLPPRDMDADQGRSGPWRFNPKP